MRTLIINIPLFLAAGLLALVFFSKSDFYGFGGDTLIDRRTLSLILFGIVLTLGGLSRIN